MEAILEKIALTLIIPFVIGAFGSVITYALMEDDILSSDHIRTMRIFVIMWIASVIGLLLDLIAYIWI